MAQAQFCPVLGLGPVSEAHVGRVLRCRHQRSEPQTGVALAGRSLGQLPAIFTFQQVRRRGVSGGPLGSCVCQQLRWGHWWLHAAVACVSGGAGCEPSQGEGQEGAAGRHLGFTPLAGSLPGESYSQADAKKVDEFTKTKAGHGDAWQNLPPKNMRDTRDICWMWFRCAPPRTPGQEARAACFMWRS